jgi:2,4-dienoyl-CoA reductase-like NADH-dependent reductase (Old Yellow Enzyme family)
MSILFEPMTVQGMTLKNRFVRSATHDGCSSEKGEITDKTLELYSGLALGGVGLIVTGFAYVHWTGPAFARQTRADSDDCIPGLKRLADKVHEYGAKIALQIAHCGRSAYAFRTRGETPLSPSRVDNDPSFTLSHRAMTGAEIEEVIDAFGQAARRGREAGFDAVQLHGGHSYLLAQFLSPRSNQRADKWGGSLENRMRFHVEVVKSVRRAVGADYPVLIKLGVQDTAENGMTLAEGCRVAQKLVACGIDAIEVSEGLEISRGNHIRKGIKTREQEAYYAPWAKEVKKAVSVPIILVGGMRSFDIMEKLVTENYTDAISMCRPFIREPGIVNRWQSGDRAPVRCLRCNRCLTNVRGETPLQCFQEIDPTEE